MAPNRFAWVLMAGVLGAASAALAEPAAAPPPAAPTAAPGPASTVSGIVVEGRATQTEQSFAAAAQTFVQEKGRTSFGHALERWDLPICPLTAGLSDDDNDRVSQRIKDIAARVGAPIGRRCSSETILVVFSDDPVQLMADVRDRRSNWLGYHFVSQRKTLAAFQPPMKSWYETSTDGRRDRTYKADGSDNPQPLCIDLASDSDPCKHNLPPLHSRFDFAFIVIDAAWAKGRPIGTIADAVAMLALTRPAPRGGCSALPSVLDLLESACPESGWKDGLTSYDEAFLKGLYAFNRGQFAGATTELALPERAAIAKRIIEDTGPAVQRAAPDAEPQPAH